MKFTYIPLPIVIRCSEVVVSLPIMEYRPLA